MLCSWGSPGFRLIPQGVSKGGGGGGPSSRNGGGEGGGGTLFLFAGGKTLNYCSRQGARRRKKKKDCYATGKAALADPLNGREKRRCSGSSDRKRGPVYPAGSTSWGGENGPHPEGKGRSVAEQRKTWVEGSGRGKGFGEGAIKRKKPTSG